MKRMQVLAVVVFGSLGLAGCSGLAQVDSAVFQPASQDHINFWGHACFYLDVGGVGIVTDPVFEKNLLLRHRMIGRPPDDALTNVKVVLISHGHVDHLSPASLKKFPKDTIVLCPGPAKTHIEKTGLDVRAMEAGEEMRIGDLVITAVVAHHPGSRWGVRSAADARALGWVIVSPRATIYYSGDSNYFSGFADVGWTYAPDVMLLNVNGHLMGEDAARASWATGARVVIPAHWGAYGYWLVGGNKRPRDEKRLDELIGDRLHVLEVGGSFAIPDTRALP